MALLLIVFVYAFSRVNCLTDSNDTLLEFPEIEIGRMRRSSINDIDKGEYCAAYRLNYEYYCQGIWTGEKLLDIMKSRHFDRIRIFCPTYKQICVIRNYREHHKRVNHRGRLDFVKTVRDKSYDEILEDLSELVPCTPECDSLVYPHCTKDCKCDYDYPTMQRFCNPPTLPLFLNVCRLWYNGCPKYEQYHYASQFIYSKAEKGKTVATPRPTMNPDWQRIPYNQD